MRRDAVAIVPAGGSARRLGPLGATGKAALTVGDRTFLDRVCAVLAAEVPRVIVVAAPETELPAVTADVEVVRDASPGAGPLAAVRDGLVHAAAAGVPPRVAILCSCDVPLVVPGVIRLLLDRAGAQVRWVLPVVGGHPQTLVSVLALDTLPLIERLLAAGRSSFRDLEAELVAGDPRAVLRVEADLLRALDPSLDSFRDVDTPADLATVARDASGPRHGG